MHSPPTACSGGKIEVTQKSTSPHAGNLSLQNNPVRRAKKTQDKAHKAKSALCHDQLEEYRHKTNSLPRLRIRRTVTRTDLTMFSEIMVLIDCSQCVFWLSIWGLYTQTETECSTGTAQFPRPLHLVVKSSWRIAYSISCLSKIAALNLLALNDELRPLSWGFAVAYPVFVRTQEYTSCWSLGIIFDSICIMLNQTVKSKWPYEFSFITQRLYLESIWQFWITVAVFSIPRSSKKCGRLIDIWIPVLPLNFIVILPGFSP